MARSADRAARRMKIVLLIGFAAVLLALIGFAWAATSMPGRSHSGALPPLTAAQQALADELRRGVAALCAGGPRNDDVLAVAKATIANALGPGIEDFRGNLAIEIRGTSDELVIVGAHYDSIGDSPGADDNASGVAAMLALARRFANAKPKRTIRFVAFVNEEPPFFRTDLMGSVQYARRCRQRNERIVAVLNLEMLGYYGGPQRYPPPLSLFYPRVGNFVAFAGNWKSRPLIRRCAASFRRHAAFPSEGAALPEVIDEIGWSDQWSFWRSGYPAVMVTDTAFFRNPHYHATTDTPETLDYESFARVVDGLAGVVSDLASAE